MAAMVLLASAGRGSCPRVGRTAVMEVREGI